MKTGRGAVRPCIVTPDSLRLRRAGELTHEVPGGSPFRVPSDERLESLEIGRSRFLQSPVTGNGGLLPRGSARAMGGGTRSVPRGPVAAVRIGRDHGRAGGSQVR